MPGLLESLGSLSRLAIERVSSETQQFASDTIGDGIAEGIKRSRESIFSLGISIALMGTGFFLTLWGIATGIDTYFAMRGLGYVLIGVLVAVTGALLAFIKR